jgi:CRISPR-associated protein Csx14
MHVSIPIDLTNPGQVLACLGLIEAVDSLIGPAEARFDWQDAGESRFFLKAEDSAQPVTDVIAFLAYAKVFACAPHDASFPKIDSGSLHAMDTFPAQEPDVLSLPIRLQDCRDATSAQFGHWADGSGRDNFKLYAGNRSALKIINDMLQAIQLLWKNQHDRLIGDPFGTLCSMGGSFNFDPRGAWTAIDTGYSLNDLKGQLQQKVMASPVLEILAAWGLEHARPDKTSTRSYRYAVWDAYLPPHLARVAFSGHFTAVSQRQFRFQLDMSGKNKIIRYAIEENYS